VLRHQNSAVVDVHVFSHPAVHVRIRFKPARRLAQGEA
jgi:hypothetical protein